MGSGVGDSALLCRFQMRAMLLAKGPTLTNKVLNTLSQEKKKTNITEYITEELGAQIYSSKYE